VLTRGFAEARRCRRELVPEPIEVDALATFDQPFHVGPAKAEVPEQRVLEDLLPWPDAGQGGVDQNEARHAAWVLRRKRIADHVADIVRDEVNVVDAQRIEHARHVDTLCLLVKASRGLGRQPHAAQVRHHDGVVARKIGCHGRPHIARLAVAVQQEHRRPGSTRAHMDRGAVGCDLSCAEFGREVEVGHGLLH
jgi:hypothetical protein